MASFADTVDQDCKDMDGTPSSDVLPIKTKEDAEAWMAMPQEDNDCLTFKRLLPKLGPTYKYQGAWK